MPPRARKSTDTDADQVDDSIVEPVGDDNDPPAVEAIDPVVVEPAGPPPVDVDGHDEPTDHTNTWPHEVSIDFKVPHVARREMATQLLEAADELGYPVAAIRTQSEGFLVPSLVYYHLFPSQTPEPADDADE